MEQFSADVGLPMSCIFPVRNYHEENATRHDVDSLVLDALRNILNFGRDYLQFKSSSSRENAEPAAGRNLQLSLPWYSSGHGHDAQWKWVTAEHFSYCTRHWHDDIKCNPMQCCKGPTDRLSLICKCYWEGRGGRVLVPLSPTALRFASGIFNPF